MSNDKYVVFKRHEFDTWFDCIVEMRCNPPDEIDDSVVIRRQDAFAPPALDAYANNIQMALSLASPQTTTQQRLQEIADYFHEQAQLSWNQVRKVPD